MRSRGFTLLEMTVVLLLVALMSAIMLQALKFGARAYAQVVKVDDANWSVFIAQRFLRSALESAYPFDPERAAFKSYGLEGTANRLAFSAAIGRSSLVRYEVFVDQHNLLVTWRPDRNGRPSLSDTPDPREILLDNIDHVEWSYAAASSDWRESWRAQRKLPALVRLRVVFRENNPRQWPELIVAPRVTDDAMSWFESLQ